jgi:hypothetical protein
MDNLSEMNNIFPRDISKRSLSSRDRSAVTVVRRMSDTLCRSAVSDEYIRAAFNKFKDGILYTRTGSPIGFCIWKVREHIRPQGRTFKDLHVYLLCAKPSGFQFVNLVLQDIEAYCTANSINYITLYPVNDTVRGYYRRYGFIERAGIFDDDIMVKTIEPSLSIRRTHMTRRATRVPRRNSAVRNNSNA